jgi:hypothetical protein
MTCPSLPQELDGITAPKRNNAIMKYLEETLQEESAWQERQRSSVG